MSSNLSNNYTGPTVGPRPVDVNAMRSFLEWWFKPCTKGRIEIAYNKQGNKEIKYAETFILGDYENVAKRAAFINSICGQNVYICAATVSVDSNRRSADKDFVQAPGVWVDQDSQESVERNVECLIRPSAIAITGTQPHIRRHLWVQTSEPISDPEAVRIFNRRLQEIYGGDAMVVNPTSLMRLPGSLAWPVKAGRSIVECTSWQQTPNARSWPIITLSSQLGTTSKNNTTNNVTNETIRPERVIEDKNNEKYAETRENGKLNIKEAWDKTETQGQWWNGVRSLVAHWVQLGLADFEIHKFDEILTQHGYTFEDTAKDIQVCIDTARNKWKITADPYAIITDKYLESAEAFDNTTRIPKEINDTVIVNNKEIKPLCIFNQTEAEQRYGKKPEFLIEGIIPKGLPVIVAGLPGVGKSPIVQKLVTYIALGINIPERTNVDTGELIPEIPVAQGKIVYISGESHGQTVRNIKRFAYQAVAKANNEPITDSVCMRANEILDDNLAHITKGVPLETDTAIIIGTVENYSNARWNGAKPDVIVIDTIRSNSVGGMNRDEDIAPITAGLTRLQQHWPDATILAIHHAPKGEPTGVTGSNRIIGHFDIIISVTAHAKGNTEPLKKSMVFSPKDTEGRKHATVCMSMVRNKSWQTVDPVWMNFSVMDDTLDIDIVDSIQSAGQPVSVPPINNSSPNIQQNNQSNAQYIIGQKPVIQQTEDDILEDLLLSLIDNEISTAEISTKIFELYRNGVKVPKNVWKKLGIGKPRDGMVTDVRRRLDKLHSMGLVIRHKNGNNTRWILKRD